LADGSHGAIEERAGVSGAKAKVAILLVVAAAAAGIGLLLRGRAPRKPTATSAPAAAAPATASKVAAKERGEIVTREEAPTSSALAGGDAAARALAEALLPSIGRRGAVDAAVAAARRGELDPVALGVKLHAAADGRPDGGEAILAALVAERDPALALQEAHALAECLGDDALRAEAVKALRDADPAARATGLLALIGRGDADCVGLAASSFAADAPDARGTAGFLLNQVPGGLDASTAAAAGETARAALSDATSPERVREESCGLLGHDGASDADVALLERALADPSVAVRGRAFLALTQTGVDAARLRPSVEACLASDGTPEEMKRAIRAWLAQQR
jgi:hypothetical protein